MAARKSAMGGALAKALTIANEANGGSWKIRSATTVNGKGISLAGGFIQPVIEAGKNAITSLAREDGMLVVGRTKNGESQRIEIPLNAVALEMVWVDG